MKESLQNEKNIVSLPNGNKLNFLAFSGSPTYKRALISIHDPSSKFYRSRMLESYTSLASIISTYKNDLSTQVIKGIEFLVKLYLGRNYSESMYTIDKLDEMTDDSSYKALLMFREQLKNQFGTSNIMINFNSENVNLFDIYIDYIGESLDISYDPLEYIYTNGFFSFKNKDKVLISIFIDPKQLKQLASNILSTTKSNKDDLSVITTFKTTFTKVLSDLLFSSFLSSVLTERYRAARESQLTSIMNIVIDSGKRGLGSLVIDGYWKNMEKLSATFYDLYNNIYLNFFLKDNSNSFLYPNFHDLNWIIGLGDWTQTNTTNPLIYYKLTSELSNVEIAKTLDIFKVKNSHREHPHLSDLTSRNTGRYKNPLDIDICRNSIAISRILPYLLYTTYIINRGFTFELTEKMINAIKASVTSTHATSGKDINKKALFNIYNKINDYLTTYSSLKSPIVCNKNVLQCMANSLLKDYSTVSYKEEIVQEEIQEAGENV
jgi:hypothetical protein